ncbi:MAG: enoyl-CoA hydratase [Proteobacteria bacterium]|nr:MAG: enoyl-CoA hydratase [Pseudomonadota bacterium]
MKLGKTVEELSIGEKSVFEKTISESDVYLFAGITGDMNPAHINEVYAAKTAFKGRIAHGMLVTGFISTVLAMQLPGPGAIYISQQVKFLAPVHIGDTVRAEVEVIDINAEKNRVTLRTCCYNQDDVQLIEGEALVSPAKKKHKS